MMVVGLYQWTSWFRDPRDPVVMRIVRGRLRPNCERLAQRGLQGVQHLLIGTRVNDDDPPLLVEVGCCGPCNRRARHGAIWLDFGGVALCSVLVGVFEN